MPWPLNSEGRRQPWGTPSENDFSFCSREKTTLWPIAAVLPVDVFHELGQLSAGSEGMLPRPRQPSAAYARACDLARSLGLQPVPVPDIARAQEPGPMTALLKRLPWSTPLAPGREGR